ncbi:MAG TPA: class I SAM-dependent methyltransferase [Actinomycetota bacterium]|nr:class I SAM-dependent methyltransferase [Actinomycetota bacterium]
MEDYEAHTYGDRIAGIYDDLYGTLFDVDATVALLAELAGDGSALELAIGTGRIALPLKEQGVDVRGIDASEAMVSELRAKPGGDHIDVVMGDFADVDVDGRFKLVFVVFNTLFALTAQDDQVRCFANVADHLTDDGLFVVEAFVPDATRFTRHQTVGVDNVGAEEVRLEASRHDPVNQRVDSQHIVLRQGKTVEMYPVSIRYSYPTEVDLMARLAGLRLRDRWGGWHKEPFTSESKFHVSVYERA